MIGAGLKTRDRSAGQQNQFVRGEEIVHARAEIRVTPGERSNFIGRETRAPFEAIANGRFAEVEVAGVKPRRLERLKRREDFHRFRPPRGIDGVGCEPERLQVANDA